MPIRRYVEKGVFTPQALSAMSTALEATMEILGLDGDEAKRGAVARFIIRLVREDDSLDAAELRDKAVAAVGRWGRVAVPGGDYGQRSAGFASEVNVHFRIKHAFEGGFHQGSHESVEVVEALSLRRDFAGELFGFALEGCVHA